MQTTAPTARHTPAPWQWHGNDLRPARPDPAHYAVHTIVTCSSGGYGFLASKTAATLAELDADRALMATAPELLQALQQLRNACCIALEGSAELAAADLAIAKALRGVPL